MGEFDLLIKDLERELRKFKIGAHINPADKGKCKQYVIELEKAIKILKESEDKNRN